MGFRSRCTRCVLTLFLISTGCAFFTGTAASQSQLLASSDSLGLRPLRDVLYQVQSSTGIDLFYDAGLIDGKYSGVVSQQNARSPEEMLQHALFGTGLYSFRLTSGTFAIKAIPPKGEATGSVRGLVFDGTTGSSLPNAHIWLFADSDRGAVSDARGQFYFDRLPAGEYVLHISHLGFDQMTALTVVLPTEESTLSIALTPRPVPISPIIIEGIQAPARVIFLRDDRSEDELAPARGYGTADALRGLGEIMGVRTGDATADIHIQGGETGEHQFQLDGVPVYEPVHLRGLLGAFNPFALERITVHKAGFSASEGSQISGVIRAEHALTSSDGRVLDMQIDPLSINARLTGIIGDPEKLHAQVMAAMRTSVWDVYSPNRLDSLFESWNAPDPFLLRASLLAAQESGRVPIIGAERQIPDSSWARNPPELGFRDIHGAFRLHQERHRSLHGSFYHSQNNMQADRFFARPEADTIFASLDQYQWWNTNAQINYSGLFGSRTFMLARARTSTYRLSHDYLSLNNREFVALPGGTIIVSELKDVDDGNYISEQAAEIELDYSLRAHEFSGGLEVVRTHHRFSLSDVYLTTINNEATNWQLNSFFEDVFHLGPWQFTAGSRFSFVPQKQSVFAEPRFELRTDMVTGERGTFTARLAGGLYRQFVHQFDISSVSPSALLPGVRFWMPIDSTVSPAKAYHLAADLLWQPTPTLSIRLESYYKHQPHILAINYPALIGQEEAAPIPTSSDVITLSNQVDFLRNSRGYALGNALAIEHLFERLRIGARYEYSLAQREYAFEGEDDVKVSLEVAPWNVTHGLNLSFDILPRPGMITTVRWRGGWDRRWGYRKAYYDFLPTNSYSLSRYDCDADLNTCDINLSNPSAHKLPPFRQLDLGIAYALPLSQAALQFRLDVLNVFNRENIADWSIRATEDDDRMLVYENDVPRGSLPRTISLALRLKW